jgi:hypothetical protein
LDVEGVCEGGIELERVGEGNLDVVRDGEDDLDVVRDGENVLDVDLDLLLLLDIERDLENELVRLWLRVLAEASSSAGDTSNTSNTSDSKKRSTAVWSTSKSLMSATAMASGGEPEGDGEGLHTLQAFSDGVAARAYDSIIADFAVVVSFASS